MTININTFFSKRNQEPFTYMNTNALSKDLKYFFTHKGTDLEIPCKEGQNVTS